MTKIVILRMVLLLPVLSLVSASGVSPEPFDRCGHLHEWEGCIQFRAWDAPDEVYSYATDLATIPDSLGEAPVRVRGELVTCAPPCPYVAGCIAGTALAACERIDLGCGVLHRSLPEEGCWTWESPEHGSFYASPLGYSSGDTLRAYAVLNYGCASTCLLMVNGCLENEVFAQCADSLSSVKPITWGTLKSVFRE